MTAIRIKDNTNGNIKCEDLSWKLTLETKRQYKRQDNITHESTSDIRQYGEAVKWKGRRAYDDKTRQDKTRQDKDKTR